MHTHLLANCRAVLVAHDERDGARLKDLAERVGFGSILPHDAPASAADQTRRVVFFLVHFGIGDEAKRQLLTSLRGAGEADFRFAPIILFLPDGPYDDVLYYIDMGFDDVICLPENSQVLQARLASQIGQEQLYVETSDYLGPDRRRMEQPGYRHAARRDGHFDHNKLTIVRTPERGIEIVRRQVFLRTLPSEARRP